MSNSGSSCLAERGGLIAVAVTSAQAILGSLFAVETTRVSLY